MDQGTQEHTITAFWHCVLILEIARAALHLDKSTHRLDDNIYRTYMQLDDKYKEYGYDRSEEHTSELQSLMRISYAVFCLKKQNIIKRMRLNIKQIEFNQTY